MRVKVLLRPLLLQAIL